LREFFILPQQLDAFVCHVLFVFLTFSKFSSNDVNVAPSFCSFAGFFSSFIFLSISSIFARIVDSNDVSTAGLIASAMLSPSLTFMTRFLHCSHQSTPFANLKSGEAHAGQESSVNVAPWRRRLAIDFMSSSFCDNLFSLKKDLVRSQ